MHTLFLFAMCSVTHASQTRLLCKKTIQSIPVVLSMPCMLCFVVRLMLCSRPVVITIKYSHAKAKEVACRSVQAQCSVDQITKGILLSLGHHVGSIY